MAIQYFSKIPTVGYDIDGSGEKQLIVNILQRVKIRDILKNNLLIFYQYVIREGERPEHIAHKLYGASSYAWLVLLTNDIVDPYYDWPRSYDDMIATIRKKYTTPERDGLEYAYRTIHHYEDLNGVVIDEENFRHLPEVERKRVYVYDWEMAQNESKRQIKLLDKSLVDQIDAEMDAIMKRVLV